MYVVVAQTALGTVGNVWGPFESYDAAMDFTPPPWWESWDVRLIRDLDSPPVERVDDGF